MKTIRVVTDIDAPIDTVWDRLFAVAEYAEWNPFITDFHGEVVTGARVKVRIAPPGGRSMTFRPTIIAVENGEKLEWLGRLLLPGLVDGRHSFSLEALSNGRTRLTQTETFSGCLVRFMGPMLARTRSGFEAMNEALRLRAESAAAASAAR